MDAPGSKPSTLNLTGTVARGIHSLPSFKVGFGLRRALGPGKTF